MFLRVYKLTWFAIKLYQVQKITMHDKIWCEIMKKKKKPHFLIDKFPSTCLQMISFLILHIFLLIFFQPQVFCFVSMSFYDCFDKAEKGFLRHNHTADENAVKQTS